VCIGPQDGCVSGGEKEVGRGALIVGGILVLPSITKGEIVDVKMI